MQTDHPAHRAGDSPWPQQHGDEADLYRRYAARLLRVTQRQFDPDLAEDACQFAWAEFLRYQPQREAAYGWLALVARRRAIKLSQRARREPPCSDVHDHQKGVLIDLASGERHEHPVSLDEALEAREALARLAALPARQREVKVAQVAGFSEAETAAMTGRTCRQTRRHRERARATPAA